MTSCDYRFLARACVSLAAGMVMFLAAASGLRAQTPSALSQLATTTAERVAKLNKEPILIAPLTGCLLDSSMCSISDSLLRAEIEKQIPNAKFIDRDAVESQLKNRGLLTIDAYDPLVIEGLAPELGAQVLVEENLYWDSRRKHYTLANSIIEQRNGKRIAFLKAKVHPSVPGDDPVLVWDPANLVSLVVINKKSSGFQVFRFPKCEFCSVPPRREMPDGPTHPTEYLTVTITEKGTVSSAGCFHASLACTAALRIVRTWRFKPAIDSNGRPFAVRSVVYVDFESQGGADPSYLPPWRNDSW